MSFSDHKIQTFTHKISDLPDQPNMQPEELKAHFDSSPEELRQALNAPVSYTHLDVYKRQALYPVQRLGPGVQLGEA